jgi:hypothetical protein
MTDTDPKSDIEVSTADGHVMVRVPLAGRVSGDWLRCYQWLARATEVPVQAQAHPDRAWIVVDVPADGNQKDASATLDAAHALIAEADAAGRAPATAQTESIAREWWARRQISAPSWILDGGGPDARLWTPPEFPNLAFPEQLNPVVAPPGWRPLFFDYLYLGFTNATAFSPTDVMPLARWAKAAMTLQAMTSLVILGLVIARAVNILR